MLILAQWTAFHGERMLTEYKVLEWLEDFVTYSSKRPIPAIMLGLSTFVCGVPVFIFVCFAIFSSIITFTGFLFIEGKNIDAQNCWNDLILIYFLGTLLTIGFGLLVCFLLVIGTIVVGVVTFGTATYLGIHRLKNLLNKVLQLSSNDTNQQHVYQKPQKPTISVSDCKSDWLQQVLNHDFPILHYALSIVV